MDSRQTSQQEITRLEQEIQARQKRLPELRARSEPSTPGPAAGIRREVTLASLFGARNDLLLVHNMGARCPYCTLWADGLNGVLGHLENRAAFVVCSPDAPDAQKSFAESRGWRFRMVSDPDGAFTAGHGVPRGARREGLPSPRRLGLPAGGGRDRSPDRPRALWSGRRRSARCGTSSTCSRGVRPLGAEVPLRGLTARSAAGGT